MTTLEDARAHIDKAREFLRAARSGLELELFNAATSSAVISGIHSKDAICLRLTGKTLKGDNHNEAVAELRSAGPNAAALAPTLSRLLRMKTKSQYQATSISAADAAKALEWATRLLESAETVISSR